MILSANLSPVKAKHPAPQQFLEYLILFIFFLRAGLKILANHYSNARHNH